MSDPEPPLPDPHFGSEEEMLDWAARENLALIYEDEQQTVVDWQAVYERWLADQ
jgi:hypothetical protein